MLQVRRDSFARGCYNRFVVCKGDCDWCGSSKSRRYSYVWQGDDKPIQFVSASAKKFCDFNCFRYYHGG